MSVGFLPFLMVLGFATLGLYSIFGLWALELATIFLSQPQLNSTQFELVAPRFQGDSVTICKNCWSKKELRFLKYT